MELVNLHNHTSLCGHASGTLREYVEMALAQNISVMGFSDHAPLPASLRPGITMAPEETETYIADVLALAKDFGSAPKILLGFEVDFPLHDSFDRGYFSDPRIDYLIGSCHFIDDWAFDHEDFIDEFSRRDIDEVYGHYFSIIDDLVSSGLFNIVGHFDLVKKFGHRATRDFPLEVSTIAKKMAAGNIAAELNTSGLIKPVGEIYPSKQIVEIFFENNVPVTLGSDSHSPEHVGYGFGQAVALLKEVGYRKICYFEKGIRHDVSL